MFTIDKTFEFCYGHRVWSQTLLPEYANDLKCACRHLHGHEAKVQVYLEAPSLQHGMVTDFRHLEWLKRWLNEWVDHKFIMDKNDPLRSVLFPLSKNTVEKALLVESGDTSIEVGAIIEFQTDSGAPANSNLMQELYGGLLLVDFVPTSENLARWLAYMVEFKMSPLGVVTRQVDWWETPKSRSSFRYP